MKQDQLTFTGQSVFAIVLNHNGFRFMSACLDSLCSQSQKGLEILVVDNGSTDGSPEFIADNYPQVKVIRNGKNLGFAEGNNVGIRYALNLGADYVLLLNNDTVSEPEAIKRMIEACQRNIEIGIVGPLIRDLDKRNEIVELGLDCDLFGYPVNNIMTRIREKTPHPFYIAGCAILIKSNVFATIGLLDSSYFIFAEDLDFCWRARLAGFEILAAPEAVVYHKSGGTVRGGAVKGENHFTSTFRLYLTQRNTMKTILKNYSGWALVFILPFSILSGLVMFVAGSSILGQSEVAKSYIRALLSNIREMPITFGSRISTQRNRRVSDREILPRMFKGSSIVKSYLGFRKLVVSKTN